MRKFFLQLGNQIGLRITSPTFSAIYGFGALLGIRFLEKTRKSSTQNFMIREHSSLIAGLGNGKGLALSRSL